MSKVLGAVSKVAGAVASVAAHFGPAGKVVAAVAGAVSPAHCKAAKLDAKPKTQGRIVGEWRL